MDNQDKILVIRQNAKADLEQLKNIEDGMVHLNKLKGIQAWVKAQKLDTELHSLVLEQELRTKRILGILYKDGQASGEIADAHTGNISGNNQHIKTGRVGDNDASSPKTRKELGLTKDQVATFKKIASIPEEAFEEHIAVAKAEVETAVQKLTTTGAVKLAEQLSGKNKDELKTAQRIAENLQVQERADELLREVNELPKQYRAYIKSRIKL